MTFQVDDPAELGRITGEVEGLDVPAGKGYRVSADTSDVDAVSAPLENMDRLVTILAASAVAVGAVVLYLVLSGRVRDRLHESGVLLSLGLGRASVVGQYLCEVLVVAAVAFSLAVPVSTLAVRTVGDALLGSASESVQTGGGEGGVSTADGVSTVSGDPFAPTFEVDGATFTDIEVEVGAGERGCALRRGARGLRCCGAAGKPAAPAHGAPRDPVNAQLGRKSMEKNPETRGGGAPALELHDVTYAYASRPRLKILNGVSASFEEGVMYAVVGPSGCGKSTLLSLLGGTRRADVGRGRDRGRPLSLARTSPRIAAITSLSCSRATTSSTTSRRRKTSRLPRGCRRCAA